MNGNAKKGENPSQFPKYGWKVAMDHKFPENRDQKIVPKLKQLPHLLPLFCRYLVWYAHIRSKGRKPFIDCIQMINGKQIYGVPLGGIGSGTIGRGFKGEFCRYQMIPGIYEYNTVMANQFIVTISDADGNTLYQKVLSPYSKYKKALKSWEWGFNGADGQYCGLYPRSWTVYNIKEQGIRLTCRQVSPVIPHDYKDSCLPVAVFVWTIENGNRDPRHVSITLTFKNGTGGSHDKAGGCWTEGFRSGEVEGVLLHQVVKGMKLSYGIGVNTKGEGRSGSTCLGFDPLGSGEDVWHPLKETGHLAPHHDDKALPKTRKGEERAVAACGKCRVEGGSSGSVEMALGWDMPTILFKSRGQTHTRRYTRWFSDRATACKDMVCYALSRVAVWEDEIEAWQDPVLKDPDLPDWFKSALFNELYFISDGGSVWLEVAPGSDEGEGKEEGKGEEGEGATHQPSQDPRVEFGRFAYLESHEYRMYNTYDVHFYASWALASLWPHLQRSLQHDVALCIGREDCRAKKYLFGGETGACKEAGAVPHDLGDPEDEPFTNINSYLIHNTNNWKDLNLKFVLQVYRDYMFFDRDARYLRSMWRTCLTVMERSFRFDFDGDGLIESDGSADQTYDSWLMHGPSAYVSSLWVASLAAMTRMADALGERDRERTFQDALDKATEALYEKLWNGEYFNFDSCTGSHSRSVMSDQLVGHWYLSLSGLETEVFRKDSVHSVLRLLFSLNVQGFKGGSMGAVNGMNRDGSVDTYTMQSEEMWTGVTYGLAATMIYEGMMDEGFQTGEGVYRTVYEKCGLGFQTPEALYAVGKYRAVGYMRPLSIWSMLRAYQMRKKADGQRATNARETETKKESSTSH